MFPDLRTERLVLRRMRADDLDALVERRNDPEVARWQNWTLPFPRQVAEEHFADADTPGPVDERWWMATVTRADTGEIMGDLVVHPTNGARTAEVGYTLARRFWGRGYAVEALDALVDWLFANLPVTRLHAGLHPDNIASAQVLERTGFVFEGHTRLSFWLGADNSDDWIYGMTRADRQAWRDRPRSAPADVELVEITPENAHEVRALRTHHSQREFVAPVLDSFADALFPETLDGVRLVPWLRAIVADGCAVGFVMLALPDAVHRSPYLWRLLIDRLHQRRGIASRALEWVVAECRAMGAVDLTASWVEGKGSPRPFYLRHSFVPTGRIVDGETEARLLLA